MSKRFLTSCVASLVCLGLFASAAAQAQTVCTSPAEEEAFQIGALKSELTVLAIGCKTEEAYNSFVMRYRAELVAKDNVVNAWFRHAYGRDAQKNYDAYITLLANEHSEQAQREGGDFCPRLLVMFKEVMALPSSTVLAEYAEAKDVVPAAVGACAGPSAAPVQTARVQRVVAKKK
jgi:hypothetical protein